MDSNIKNNLQSLLSELETISTIELREHFNVRWKMFLDNLNLEDRKDALHAFLNQTKENALHIEDAISHISTTKAA